MAAPAEHLDPLVAPDHAMGRRAGRPPRRQRHARRSPPAQVDVTDEPAVPPSPGGEVVNARRRWTDTREQLLERLTIVEDAIMGALERPRSAVEPPEVVDAAQSIAVATAGFGLTDASNRALAIARQLPEIEAPDDPRLRSLFDDLTVLRSQITPQARERQAKTGVDGWASLVVFSDDDVWAEQVRSEAAVRGLQAHQVEGVIELLDALRDDPDTLVADLSGGSALLDVLDGTVPPASVVVSAGDRLQDRVDLAAAGFGRALPADASARDAVDAATALVTGQRISDARVLLWTSATMTHRVDVGALTMALGELGIGVIEAGNVVGAWDAVVGERPDLVIAIDDTDGIEVLCQIVRADAQRATLPIIAMVPVDEPGLARLYTAGSDDVLALGAEPTDVAAHARQLVVRARLQQKQAELDPLTGLANEAGALRAVERLSSVATRQQSSLAIGAIQVDSFGRLNELHGRALGDDVLQSVASHLHHAFRGTDVVARLGASEFLVAFLGADRDQAAIRLRALAASLRELELTSPSGVPVRVTLSVGIAALPTDGDDTRAVRRAAGEALRQARVSGGDQVVTAAASLQATSEQDLVDVVVVESDQTLADLLLEALRTRGWRSRHVADGQQALQLLTGPHPPVRARVVLLDVDLPGHDGFTILRRLSEAGTLKDTRVMVVTSLATEAETVAAFEAGASDHVAKPFSLPVLLERVRRALDDGS